MSPAPNTPATPTPGALVKSEMPQWLAEPLEKFIDNPAFNLLLPSMPINTELHPWFRLSVSVVRLSANPDDGDIFQSGYRGAPLYSPSKIGLDKLADAAGITFFNPKRIDDCKDPDRWMCEISGRIRTASGEVREASDVYGIYMPDVSEDAYKNRVAANARAKPEHKKTEEQMRAAHDAEMKTFRRHALSRCMTGARLRVTRLLLPNAPMSKPAAHIAKPNIIVRFDFQGDMSDPQVKAAMLERAQGAVRTIYGPEPPTGRPLSVAEEMDEEPARLPAASAPEPEVDTPADEPRTLAQAEMPLAAPTPAAPAAPASAPVTDGGPLARVVQGCDVLGLSSAQRGDLLKAHGNDCAAALAAIDLVIQGAEVLGVDARALVKTHKGDLRAAYDELNRIAQGGAK